MTPFSGPEIGTYIRLCLSDSICIVAILAMVPCFLFPSSGVKSTNERGRGLEKRSSVALGGPQTDKKNNEVFQRVRGTEQERRN